MPAAIICVLDWKVPDMSVPTTRWSARTLISSLWGEGWRTRIRANVALYMSRLTHLEDCPSLSRLTCVPSTSSLEVSPERTSLVSQAVMLSSVTTAMDHARGWSGDSTGVLSV